MRGEVVGEGRGGERRPELGCRRVEQGCPVRVGLGRRVAVRVGLADRGDRPPELPVVLVRVAADEAVGGGEVLHREQTRILDDVEAGPLPRIPLAPCKRR